MNGKFRKCDKCPLLLIYRYYLVKLWLIQRVLVHVMSNILLINIVIDPFILTFNYQSRDEAQKMTGMVTWYLTTKSQI